MKKKKIKSGRGVVTFVVLLKQVMILALIEYELHLTRVLE